MKENKKMLLILGIIFVLVLGLVIIVNKKGNADEEVMEDFYNLFNSRKYELLYIAKSDCQYCSMFDNNLKEIEDIQKIDYLKITIDKILTSSANEIIEKLEWDGSTPYVAIIKEGEVVDSFGYVEPNELLETLKTYNILDKSASLYLNYLELKDYYEIFSSNKKSIIALSSSDNIASKTRTFKNILKEISKENSIDINYLELLFTSDEEYNTFVETFEIIKTTDIPILAVIENQKIVDYTYGTTSKEEILTMLKRNNIIK